MGIRKLNTTSLLFCLILQIITFVLPLNSFSQVSSKYYFYGSVGTSYSMNTDVYILDNSYPILSIPGNLSTGVNVNLNMDRRINNYIWLNLDFNNTKFRNLDFPGEHLDLEILLKINSLGLGFKFVPLQHKRISPYLKLGLTNNNIYFNRSKYSYSIPYYIESMETADHQIPTLTSISYKLVESNERKNSLGMYASVGLQVLFRDHIGFFGEVGTRNIKSTNMILIKEDFSLIGINLGLFVRVSKQKEIY